MSTELETEKRIPPSLKGTIYQIFLEAISEEIKLFREQARQQKTSFYVKRCPAGYYRHYRRSV